MARQPDSTFPAGLSNFDMERCLRAWSRRTEGTLNQPSVAACQAYFDKAGRLCVDLENINGVLATYSVTPKRVTLLRVPE
jgi:hypothetical protein